MLIFILAHEEHWGENQPPLHKSGAFLSGHLFAAVSDPAGAGGGVCVCVCVCVCGLVMGVIGGDGGYGCYWRPCLHHVMC